MSATMWKDVGAVEDIPHQGARTVETSLGKIALFKDGHGEVFAIEDKCPHLGGPLSQGIVHGASVTCPLHNWVIDMKSGGVIGPDEGCVVTLPVKIEGDRVHLDFSAFLKRAA